MRHVSHGPAWCGSVPDGERHVVKQVVGHHLGAFAVPFGVPGDVDDVQDQLGAEAGVGADEGPQRGPHFVAEQHRDDPLEAGMAVEGPGVGSPRRARMHQGRGPCSTGGRHRDGPAAPTPDVSGPTQYRRGCRRDQAPPETLLSRVVVNYLDARRLNIREKVSARPLCGAREIREPSHARDVAGALAEPANIAVRPRIKNSPAVVTRGRCV